MPIYEFYCSECHRIFNFFSRSINTEKRPLCPKCGKVKLERWMSVFATVKNRGDTDSDEDMPIPDLDEAKMEKAMNLLAREADHMDEDDPRQAANLMRKLTDMTGLKLGPGMEEALRRMEAGEDPEQIEEEMGDILEEEDPFQFQEKKGGGRRKTTPPQVDDTLYEL
ncbi:MAG: zinc ribbon domain-containing protein [Deltaproteobacteria bacterium]|nr:MAG: zinc ribbon domain-containing protein [Deltaproteobacteria bacterium]